MDLANFAIVRNSSMPDTGHPTVSEPDEPSANAAAHAKMANVVANAFTCWIPFVADRIPYLAARRGLEFYGNAHAAKGEVSPRLRRVDVLHRIAGIVRHEAELPDERKDADMFHDGVVKSPDNHEIRRPTPFRSRQPSAMSMS